MIVFIDGPDGSGKSTLIAHLAPALVAHGRTVAHAPPLWTYLNELSAPEDFAPWVRTTTGSQIAHALLEAKTRRIQWLITTAARLAQDVVLVDRGPKTVICSALAHHKTGIPLPNDPQLPYPSTDQNRAQLEQHVHRLAAFEACTSIELRLPEQPGGLDVILPRLSQREELPPSYVGYLDALIAEMATFSWAVLPLLPLDATAGVAVNAEASLTSVLGGLAALPDA
ncbi:AAA family ATPase [Micromonospora sp. DT229]|uniref:AAA family ATPase n=1 Tax=Micromonospora sp. DT229 TaxID=3393430 RepID=UPI003CEDFFB6